MHSVGGVVTSNHQNKGTTDMTKITAFNTLGTKESRVVATFDVDGSNLREALNEAVYLASRWNKDESRADMIVNFVSANGMVRAI